jgi:RNA recognition motif-containing protein
MTDTARWKATVYVGGLGPQVTVANVHDAFIPFGDIADVSLPKNDRNGKTDRANGANEDDAVADAEARGHRGFAYVEFEDADDAKEAIDNMDKSEFFGRSIKVTAAKAPKIASEGLGSTTALWNQVSVSQINCLILTYFASRSFN